MIKKVVERLSSQDPKYIRDPYEMFRGLPASADSVSEVEFEGVRVWLVTGHEQTRRALVDPALSADPGTACPAARAVPWVFAENSYTVTQNMLRSDPPVHTRLRRLVTAEFTGSRVAALRPRIQSIVDELVDEFLPAGHADVMRDFAQRLPLTVICDVLGIPALDRTSFARLAMIYVGMDDGDSARLPEATSALRDYLVDLCAGKASQPAPDGDEGLLDRLARPGSDGDALTRDELVAMSFLLLVAGFETTASLIGNSVHALLTRDGELPRLREDPARIPLLIDEVLRFDGPIKVAPVLRFTRGPVRIGDTLVPGGGEPVLFAYAAANRDPAYFPDPCRFDPRRNTAGHLGFGYGPHRCVGAALGKAEAEIAVGTLVRRADDLALAVDSGELAWGHSRFMRGLTALPVTFTPAVRTGRE